MFRSAGGATFVAERPVPLSGLWPRMDAAERALEELIVVASRQLALEHRGTAERMGRAWSGRRAALEVAVALEAEAARRERKLEI